MKKNIKDKLSHCCKSRITYKISEDGKYKLPICENCNTICVEK